MKRITTVLAVIFLISCGNQKRIITETTQETIDINQTIPDEDTIILIGRANEDGFKQEPFNIWYEKNYSEYEVNPNTSSSLKHLLKDVKIKAFMGTWCSDSQRETPRFYKIIKDAGFDENDIELITMSREKDTPEGYEVGLNITNVPTFIFYKNDKEINRIVESPITSLEKDMISILTGQEYKHTYAD